MYISSHFLRLTQSTATEWGQGCVNSELTQLLEIRLTEAFCRSAMLTTNNPRLVSDGRWVTWQKKKKLILIWCSATRTVHRGYVNKHVIRVGGLNLISDLQFQIVKEREREQSGKNTAVTFWPKLSLGLIY